MFGGAVQAQVTIQRTQSASQQQANAYTFTAEGTFPKPLAQYSEYKAEIEVRWVDWAGVVKVAAFAVLPANTTATITVGQTQGNVTASGKDITGTSWVPEMRVRVRGKQGSTWSTAADWSSWTKVDGY